MQCGCICPPSSVWVQDKYSNLQLILNTGAYSVAATLPRWWGVRHWSYLMFMRRPAVSWTETGAKLSRICTSGTMNGTVQKERRPTGSQQCLWRLQIRYRKTAREQRTDLTATVLEASKSTLMYSYYVLSEGKQGQTKRRGLNQLKRTILIKVFLIKSRQISQKTQGDLYDGVTLFFHKSKNICEEKHKALTLQTTAEREEKPRTTNLTRGGKDDFAQSLCFMY